MAYSSPSADAAHSSRDPWGGGLGAHPTSPPTVQDVEMGRVGGVLGTWGGWSIRWQDAIPSGSGLPPVVRAWTGDMVLDDAGKFAQLIRDGYTIHTSSCEGDKPLGATAAGKRTVEFTLDARTAFLVAQRCPGSFLPRQARALRDGAMPLATPQGALDFMWALYTRPQDFPEFTPRSSFTPPPVREPDPWAAACDIVAHQEAVADWQHGRITSAQLLDVARRCIEAGGQLDTRLWNERNIPGFLLPGGAPTIVQTGDGTVTLPDGTEIEAPSGGTTPLPPSEPRPQTCPEGYYLAEGRCWAPWDPNGPDYDGSEPPGPGDPDAPPPPPSGEPPSSEPERSSLVLWGAAGLGMALLLGRRRRT